MNRVSHLQWAKDRALALVKQGDLNQAIASIQSDLGKHPELRDLIIMVHTVSMGLMLNNLFTSNEVIKLIQGIN